ncbi:Aste57867_10128 [Aphanomyces stellatus]|uniref:Aste57867_10128 protein n=1 Tax=Aphanomyces stellatus TaxID=120398 RepID=A0A485KQJ1_9STRA|nr:hypothetical protein As57867_010089 [Aphanomyces stellatus]VFT87004.1 Aste57867_10128 [Aphanomyces stellatus]
MPSHPPRDVVLALREGGRYILAALALLMLWQAVSIGLRVTDTICNDAERAHWSDSAVFALVACYIGWIVVTSLGGLCGLYSSAYYDIPTAGWCLRSWWLLILFQLTEGAVLFGVLCQAPCSAEKLWPVFGWKTLALLGTQGFFIVYIYMYMHILQLAVDTELKAATILLVAASAKLRRAYGTSTPEVDVA